jgi:hypothetical protein
MEIIDSDGWAVCITNLILSGKSVVPVPHPNQVCANTRPAQPGYAQTAKKRKRGLRVPIKKVSCHDNKWRSLIDMRMESFRAHICSIKESSKDPWTTADNMVQRVRHYLITRANNVSPFRWIVTKPLSRLFSRRQKSSSSSYFRNSIYIRSSMKCEKKILHRVL